MAVAQVSNQVDWQKVKINLATKTGRPLLADSGKETAFWDRCTFDRYLNTLKPSPLTYKDVQIFAGSFYRSGLVFLKDKLLYTANGTVSQFVRPDTFAPLMKTLVLAGVFIKKNKDAVAENDPKAIYLLNGDVEESVDSGDYPDPSPVDFFNGHSAPRSNQHPVCSFNCLLRFYNMNYRLVEKRFASGELKVLDYHLDESRSLTTREHEKLEKVGLAKFRANPPERGFTLIGNNLGSCYLRWHRSGAVLLWDKVDDAFFLLGQDEGTYFGVELPEVAHNIQQAFDVLMPEEIRGKEYQRQGEWFVVPVAERDVPKQLDCSIQVEPGGYFDCYLPIEADDSNKHNLHSVDIRVAKDTGRVYALAPTLRHEEHETVAADGWNAFYRNTALRSFSQMGVD